MAEAYAEFLSFDWGDERWRAYLNGLYPPPNQDRFKSHGKEFSKTYGYKNRVHVFGGPWAQFSLEEQIAKFKKKWYKKWLGTDKFYQ